LIRAARPTDKRAVRDLCARIWSDDYVAHVFDDWVRDRSGRLWVAVEDGAVVGVAKLTLAPSGEAWLHGLRVHPEHRRKGVATALLEHRLARARRLGARVARLDTAEDNVAVHRLMRRYRFRRVARMAYYEAPAVAGARPRLAERSEIAAVWRVLRAPRRMLYESHFAREVVRDDVASATRERRCFVAGPLGRPTAVAIADRARGDHGSRLVVRALAGAPARRRELLRALRAEASARRAAGAGISAPSELWPAVIAAGYRRRWAETMFVFERRL
jgi:ribosomal protein S18 acetylase RimI-like enzyme